MSTQVDRIAAAVEMFNAGDASAYVRALYHPDAVYHGFPDMFPPTRDGIQSFFEALFVAMPDIKAEPLDIVEAGDRVAVRLLMSGTHEGELFGSPGTGKSVTVEAMTIFRFDGDYVAERWNRLDDLGFLTQIGVLQPMNA